jgi:cbb3-type cytochrome oxidase maturation protein
MAVIIILLTASISVAAIFLVAFLWSVRDKQFDDNYSPAVRILFETPVSDPSIPDTLTGDTTKTETAPYAGR